MLALDSDVCPTPVTYPVAPLNTYTLLKKWYLWRSIWRSPDQNRHVLMRFICVWIPNRKRASGHAQAVWAPALVGELRLRRSWVQPITAPFRAGLLAIRVVRVPVVAR